MTLQKGHYKTSGGLRAIVAQIKPNGTQGWMARGAILYEGVWYFHFWKMNGLSFTNVEGVELVKED